MKLAFGADHAGFALKQHLADVARNAGHTVVDFGTNGPESVDYPDYGEAVGRAVVNGEAELGVVICSNGVGISIAANKVPGVRAALCTDAETARGARRWNDANVLAFGLRLTTAALAEELLDAFLDTAADPSEADNVAKLA